MHKDMPSEILRPSIIFLLSCAVAATAANLYYTQPLLPLMGKELGVEAGQLGMIPALSQLGYAAAILLISPLGDVLPRRRLINILSVTLVGGALLAYVAPNSVFLGLACLIIGISANITQQILPLAATLSSPQSRGRVIASIMTGLTTGILLSRTISGAVAEHFGWRMVFLMSATIATVFGLMLHRILPDRPSPLQHSAEAVSYKALLLSLWTLLRSHPALRQSMLTGMCWFAAFNALWAALALHVTSAPFYFSVQQAGLFGVVALAGIAGAKLSGRWVTKLGVGNTISLGIGLILIGFGISAAAGESLSLLIISIVLIDFGVFMAQVANQVRVFSIDSNAQSRVNSVYMLGYYLGGAVGSLSSVAVYDIAGWQGVCILAAAFLCSSLIANHSSQSRL